MKIDDLVTLPGTESVWGMGPGGFATLKLLNSQTVENVMAFEEVTPAGVETPLTRALTNCLIALVGKS